MQLPNSSHLLDEYPEINSRDKNSHAKSMSDSDLLNITSKLRKEARSYSRNSFSDGPVQKHSKYMEYLNAHDYEPYRLELLKRMNK